MKKPIKIVLAITIPLLVTASVTGILINHFFNEQLSELDLAIMNLMTRYNVPSVAVSAITNEEIVWMSSYGLSNIENNVIATTDTLFMLGSISKSVTSAAFMQLVEKGLTNLDTDINEYLPYDVYHPVHPDTIITPRMLMTHTSGITDNGFVIYALHSSGEDSPIPLATFTYDYLNENGIYYCCDNFNSNEPGTSYDYSNVGSAIIAYIVEEIVNTSFEQYCQNNLFLPLGMNNSSWFLSNLDVNDIAMPYQEVAGNLIPIGHYGSPVYPCGFLRTSIKQFSNFLMMVINDGIYQEKVVLQSSSVNSMTTIQLPYVAPNTGLFWQSDGRYWGHGGSEPGVSTLMLFDPIRNVGVNVFTNVEGTVVTSLILNEVFLQIFGIE